MDDDSNNGMQSLGDIFKAKVPETKKATAYAWQELALRVIKDLAIPNFKRGAVFKVCKENSKEIVERAMNDTKELCTTGEQWKYFFKVIGGK